MLRSLLAAGLLNRTLVVSLNQRAIYRHYDRRLVLDFDQIRDCYGKNTIMTTSEYSQQHGGRKLTVDTIKCWGEPYGCPVKHAYQYAAKAYAEFDDLYLSPTLLHVNANLPHRVTVEQFLAAYGGLQNNSVLLIGDMFGPRIIEGKGGKHGLFHHGDLPFRRADSCPLAVAVQPPKPVRRAAELYVGGTPELRSKEYLGIHWRRGDFRGPDGMFRGMTIERAAGCIAARLNATGLRIIYLATNGEPEEVGNRVCFVDLCVYM